VNPTAKYDWGKSGTALVTLAEAKLFTALAMDCLRLSMHFFLPIQQCAQQVYHTALPLSPTSSPLRNSYIRSITDNQLSRVATFSGAPDKWGLLLRTIDIRPNRLVCVATSAQRIIAAREDAVNIYDAITFVLRQSLRISETVTKIRGTPDESTLFFAHSHSVTMWDVQTGGLTHTFTTRSEIADIAVSTTGDRIACGSSDGSVTFWNVHTKAEVEGFGNGQPVVAIFWLSSRKLAVATQGTVYTYDIGDSETLGSVSIPGHVWGMVRSPLGRGELLVGTSRRGEGANRDWSFLRITTSKNGHLSEDQERLFPQSLARPGEELSSPTVAGNVVACITPPRGVRSFDTVYQYLMGNPSLLDTVTPMAVSLNRNLVAQTEDSIQIFSLGVLTSGEARNDAYTSHIYPLGGKHIISLLQPNRHLAILDLRTLQELPPSNNTSSLGSLPTNRSLPSRASFSRGLVAEYGVSVIMQAWRSGTPLPEWAETPDEDPPLSGLSPDCTRIVTFYGSPRRELHVKDAKDGTVLASLPIKDNDWEMGEVYDIVFDSKTRFHLKVDVPGQHVQIPYDIVPSPSGSHSYTINKAGPVLLSEPRATPPYKLDANCEWVVDAQSRKVCWVSPGDVRRGNGGHFWAGLSLVMVEDDGVVRKLSFRKPDS
jgi:WD40 repeat protein